MQALSKDVNSVRDYVNPTTGKPQSLKATLVNYSLCQKQSELSQLGLHSLQCSPNKLNSKSSEHTMSTVGVDLQLKQQSALSMNAYSAQHFTSNLCQSKFE